MKRKRAPTPPPSLLKRAVVEELHKPARRNFKRRKVEIRGLFDLWQADLVEMIPHSRINKGFKYLLTVIDTCSKMAWAEPSKDKTGSSVTEAMRSVLKRSAKAPKNLQVDQGNEFYNTEFKALMAEHGINLYSSYSSVKASIVERFNRTLKTKMWKEFSLRGSYKWADILDRLLSEYNNTVHRTTGMKPIDVTTPEAEKRALARINGTDALPLPGASAPERARRRRKLPKTKFKVGDHVRLSRQKSLFEKGYTPNWGTEIFRVKTVRRTHPVTTYLLQDLKGKDIKGGFYNEELQRTSHKDTYLVEKVIRRKGARSFVKWLGFDKTHNAWINTKDIV